MDERERKKEGEVQVEPQSEDASALNILIVDDTEEAGNGAGKLIKAAAKGKGKGNCNVQVVRSPSEAITIIYRNIKESRTRIHLVISDVYMPAEDDGISFLRSIRTRITPQPFTAVMSGYPDSEKLRGISDKFLSKPEDITIEKFKEVLDECIRHWESIEAENMEESVLTDHAGGTKKRLPSIPPSPMGDKGNTEIKSPFPPLRKFDTHNPLKIPDESLPLALFDLDGTLTRGSTTDVILLAGFVRHLWETQDKNLWGPLKDRFDDWMGVNLGEITIEDFYRKWKPEHDKQEADTYGFYEDQIEMTSKIFGRCLREMEVEEIKRLAKDWVTEQMSSEKSLFYDYTKPIIDHTSKMGIYSVIITGAPDFLVKPIADQLGVPFYFGMEFETKNKNEEQESESSKELFTGAVRYITGKKDSKKKICDKLDEQNKPRLIGMGNSDADEPILDATETSILVNPGSKDSRFFNQYPVFSRVKRSTEFCLNSLLRLIYLIIE